MTELVITESCTMNLLVDTFVGLVQGWSVLQTKPVEQKSREVLLLTRNKTWVRPITNLPRITEQNPIASREMFFCFVSRHLPNMGQILLFPKKYKFHSSQQKSRADLKKKILKAQVKIKPTHKLLTICLLSKGDSGLHEHGWDHTSESSLETISSGAWWMESSWSGDVSAMSTSVLISFNTTSQRLGLLSTFLYL